MYESTITFTFDTICPWTYLAKKRLDQTLDKYDSKDVKFELRLTPYQLYPSMAPEGQPKREWYTRERYNSDHAKFEMYEKVMGSYAAIMNFSFNWDGDVANTLDAHRVIQIFQGTAEELQDDPVVFADGKSSRDKYGPATANKILMSLYRQYFEAGKHPSKDDTLLVACKEAGVEDIDAEHVIVEDRDLGRRETVQMVKMAGINGVDSVPYIVLEGKRRDLTLVGAKEIVEYEKALATIVKESN